MMFFAGKPLSFCFLNCKPFNQTFTVIKNDVMRDVIVKCLYCSVTRPLQSGVRLCFTFTSITDYVSFPFAYYSDMAKLRCQGFGLLRESKLFRNSFFKLKNQKQH